VNTNNNQLETQPQGEAPVAANPTTTETPTAETVNADNLGNESTSNAVLTEDAGSDEAEASRTEPEEAPEALLTEATEGEEGEEQGNTLGAPEQYDLPQVEGMEEFNADNPGVARFMEVARKLDLSNEAMATLYREVGPLMKMDTQNLRTRALAAGVSATKADPELGGVNFKETCHLANKAFNDKRFCTPALRQLLDQSGLVSHPEVLRLFRNIGKLTGEGSFPKGNQQTFGVNDSRSMFPNSKLNP
jgi:hypothetical protein